MLAISRHPSLSPQAVRSRASCTLWTSIHHIRVPCPPKRADTALTGISRTKAMTSTLNSSVKPEPARAQGTLTSFGVHHARSACSQIRRILHKVHVPPRFLGGVMHRNHLPADWAGESGSASKVAFYVEPFVSLENSTPTTCQGGDTKGKTKKRFRLHD